MNHLTESRLNEFLDGTLTANQQRTAGLHLAGCPACRSRLEDLHNLAGSLAALTDVPLARDLTPSVLAALPSKKPARSWKLALALQAGAALGLVLLTAGQLDDRIRSLIPQFVLPAFLFPAFKLPDIQLPALRLPTVELPSLSLPVLHIPQPGLQGLDLSSVHLFVLAAGATALFVVGNTLLLGKKPEAEPSGRRER